MTLPRESWPKSVTITPLTSPPDVTLNPPGSKSITNRALLCAALAQGSSTVSGVLLADDTEAMLHSVQGLGAGLDLDRDRCRAVVQGRDPRTDHSAVTLQARSSGTTSRFVLPVAAVRAGRTTVDGTEQLRARPFGPLLDALRGLGGRLEGSGPAADRLPVQAAGGAVGGEVCVPGHLSSQFLSGLLMAAPLMEKGLHLTLSSPLVSVPYVTMTMAVMEAFGVQATREDDGSFRVSPQAYQAANFTIEPDASAASYLFGAAAISGGRVTVEGLGTGALQGDLEFVRVLEQMGATVTMTATSTTVQGPSVLRGVDIDMRDISDTAQTLAAVAVFADRPTRVRGIGFIRAKETDRIGAVVTELRRAGIDAVEHDDGFTVNPGRPVPTAFETYDDHRMAMSLALLGLKVPGVVVLDPQCVSKTYPNFFDDLARVGK
ncbi:3-phosphoshikimate 1-carboxyvinyltransferase [Kineosporia babensis]|uniref:3-phosphoshikimate 1-carboxyvinyltransferase n=1 Tax=Kineosporia babensis TaxID=499548 RepID=A0A9X1STB4_9ACTN|nr:3-phosphoshikimate 1-carboxyvinyltransferase [Kineosporia babensis]